MNGWKVILYSSGRGMCWVEEHWFGKQRGDDIDCKTRTDGLKAAARLSESHKLDRFTEERVHKLSNNAVGKALRDA